VAVALFLLGFASAGFFDGILLHQILQWHHLLSLVTAPAVRDVRVQILADGLFHALMYGIAIAGAALLWSGRREAAHVPAGRLFAMVLLGFGSWHIVDGLLFHWILGLHRIRVDVAEPLFWDLLWFFMFGVAFLAAGWLMHRTPARSSAVGTLHGIGVISAIGAGVLAAGVYAAMPPQDQSATLVLFREDVAPSQIFQALDTMDGRVLWAGPSGIWAVSLRDKAHGLRFYRHGALLVSNSVLPAGCLSWTQPQ
jgi:uncharacterized membrane protein